MKPFLYPFLFLAGVGLFLSAAVHLLTWVGLSPPENATVLHFGIFVVWLPTVIVSTKLTRDYKQREFWKAALRGAPRWAERAVMVVGIYAFVIFASFLLLDARGEDGPTRAEELWMFSAMWMGLLRYGTWHAVFRDPCAGSR